MLEFLNGHWLDILTTVLGLIYIWLEYRASIALWVVGIIMPALDIWLYWNHGLYGDAGMAVYYTLAAVYGYAVWKFGRKKNQATSVMPITHTPARLYLPIVVFFFVAWGLTYYVLVCGPLGSGKEIYRTVVLLDCSRCGVHSPLCAEGHPLQGRTLRTLCGDCRDGVL